MYNKRGHVNLETSANFHNRLDTNLAFFSTDLGTADLVFNITRNNLPLMVSAENASTLLILMKGDEYIIQEVEYVDPMNGQLKVTVDDKVLARPGKWKGQIYIEVHDVNNPSKEDIVTQAEFTFDIKDSVINTIPAIDKLNEIRTFIEFRESIMEQINAINEGLENGSDYITQMEATLTSGMKALNDRTLQVVNQLENDANDYSQALVYLKDQSIAELDEKANKIKTDVEALNKFDTTEWQKSKITGDDGFVRIIGSPDLSVTTLDNYFTKTEKAYVTTPVNSPNGNGVSGFIDVTFRSSGYAILTFQPYTSNLVYMTRRTNSPTWSDWVLTNPDTNTRKWLGTLGQEGNVYNDILKLPGGKYEASIPADALSVNAPLDPNGGGYIAEIDVTESGNKRKQLKLIANARNDEYRATVHSANTQFPDGQFTGWKKVQNEDEYNQLNNDTGWIDWETKGNATKRNTTDDTQIKCQYRIRKVNGTRIAHLRVNVNNLTTQVAFGSIPAEYVPVEQHFVPRMPVSLHPGALLVSKEGNLIFYQNTNDTSWLPGHYIVGEFTWLID
ncbi:minor tail protein [Staphylococcus phage PG-2021_4]